MVWTAASPRDPGTSASCEDCLPGSPWVAPETMLVGTYTFLDSSSDRAVSVWVAPWDSLTAMGFPDIGILTSRDLWTIIGRSLEPHWAISRAQEGRARDSPASAGPDGPRPWVHNPTGPALPWTPTGTANMARDLITFLVAACSNEDERVEYATLDAPTRRLVDEVTRTPVFQTSGPLRPPRSMAHLCARPAPEILRTCFAGIPDGACQAWVFEKVDEVIGRPGQGGYRQDGAGRPDRAAVGMTASSHGLVIAAATGRSTPGWFGLIFGGRGGLSGLSSASNTGWDGDPCWEVAKRESSERAAAARHSSEKPPR